MRLPAPLLRLKKNVHKYDFGHVLVLAGSRNMLGAAALISISAMRAGAGLVTAGIPQSLNSALQKKISAVVMTLPLAETKEKSLSLKALAQIQKQMERFDVIALGPGLSRHPQTQRFILKCIAVSQRPLVIDADALYALSANLKVLTNNDRPKILTPHWKEMSRLTGLHPFDIEKNAKRVAQGFAKKFHCVVVLKGPRTIVASSNGEYYVNRTGNSGLATAGSGDVLTGIIAAFLGQRLGGFEAAQYGVYVHGLAGDLAAKDKSRTGLIATDLIDYLPMAFTKTG